MRSRASTIACCMTLALCAPASWAATTTLLGRTAVLKDSSAGTDPAKRRLAAKAQSPAPPLAGDPRTNGAFLAMETDAGEQQVALPAAGWRATRDGFTYGDSAGTHGPARSVRLRRNAQGVVTLKVVASGARATLDMVPPDPGTYASIAVAIFGGDTHCAHFGGVAGGTVDDDGARRFTVRRPTALGPCPGYVLPASTTSSTTTTSTSGTTTSIPTGTPCGQTNGAPLCWGECPPETPICATVGDGCVCVAGTTPCADAGVQQCDGACPSGEVCVSGGFDCACMPVGQTPCFTGAVGGACGTFCPPDETCQPDLLPVFPGCGCVPQGCQTFSTCGGPCPVGRSCRLVSLGASGSTCLCL